MALTPTSHVNSTVTTNDRFHLKDHKGSFASDERYKIENRMAVFSNLEMTFYTKEVNDIPTPILFVGHLQFRTHLPLPIFEVPPGSPSRNPPAA